ncbi:MAG: GGDEF domain-containing protein [Lachnospiraceae bacterium]|nr:GGDEF domain-containing protein [Lachnospiraceae bacterium]
MQENQIHKMINELIHRGYDSKNKLQFVKHYNDFSISPEFVEDIIKESNFKFFAHEFSLDTMQSAYEPFFDWIKILIDDRGDIEVRDFLEECEVYPLQYDMIESFYFTGECKRNEDILLHELTYEINRMMDNMVRIFRNISQKQPIFILLNRIHYAHASTLKFLNYMIHELADSNIYILGVYNGEQSANTYYMKEWKKFLELTENRCNVVTWVYREKIHDVARTDFTPKDEEFDDYLVKINNMLELGAYTQADYYLSFLHQKFEEEESNFSHELWNQVNLFYMRNFIYLNDVSNALHISNEIKARIQHKEGYDTIFFMVEYYICMTEILNHRNELVGKCIKNCHKIVERSKDEMLKLRLLTMKHVLEYDGFHSQQVRNFQDECDFAFVELLEKYKFTNHLAYYYTNCLGNNLESIQRENSKEKNEKFYEKGLELARSIGNDNCILVFYNTRIVLASSLGKFSYSEKYFKQIIPLIEKSNSRADLCKNLNGLGYVTCVNGTYQKSYDYYVQALQAEKEIGDTKLIAETLYNMCITSFLAKDYKSTIRYVEMTVEIVEGMGYYAFVCNISKVYALAALANHFDNNEYSCHFYMDKMKRFIAHLLRSDDETKCKFWDDDLMLYYLLCALLDKKEGNYENAVSNFLISKEHLFKTPGFFFFGYPVLALEFADCYEKMGLTKEAEQVLEDAIEGLRNANYVSEIPELEAKKNKVAFEKRSYDFEISKELEMEIKNLANEAVMRRINKGLLSHSEFLSIWQNVINDKNTVEEVYENAYPAALNHFAADQMLIFSKQNQKLALSCSFYEEEFSERDLQIIEKFAKLHPNGFVASRMHKEFYFYKEVIEIFGFDDIVSFMMVPYIKDKVVAGVAILYIVMREDFRKISNLFDSEGLVMFKVAYRQMVDLIEKIDASAIIKKMNERLLSVNKQLEESVVKDALTGIFNREGYARKEQEIENMKTIKDCVVLYFDLDNFKYYNDSFGHDIGDLVLTQLAEILKHLAKVDGIPIRYGGDEFLLIVPDISIEQAEEIAKEFYEILKQKQYFIPKIEKKLKKFVHIPEEKRISSSIGIARTDYLSGCNLEMAIKHADAALYCVKKNSKKNYKVWKQEDIIGDL